MTESIYSVPGPNVKITKKGKFGQQNPLLPLLSGRELLDGYDTHYMILNGVREMWWPCSDVPASGDGIRECHSSLGKVRAEGGVWNSPVTECLQTTQVVFIPVPQGLIFN